MQRTMTARLSSIRTSRSPLSSRSWQARLTTFMNGFSRYFLMLSTAAEQSSLLEFLWNVVKER